jgi:hypothetical protein
MDACEKRDRAAGVVGDAVAGSSSSGSCLGSWLLALAATDCPCPSLDALTLQLVASCAATVPGLCWQRMLLPLVSGAARGVAATGDALGAHVAQHQRCRLAIPLGNIAHGLRSKSHLKTPPTVKLYADEPPRLTAALSAISCQLSAWGAMLIQQAMLYASALSAAVPPTSPQAPAPLPSRHSACTRPGCEV